DPYLLVLDRGLDLELRVLHEALDLLAELGVDALPQRNGLLRCLARDYRLVGLQAGEVDAALRELELQDVEHLLELKVRLRGERHDRALMLEFSPGTLEIEALPDLAARLVDRVGDFVEIDFRDDIEGRHGS